MTDTHAEGSDLDRLARWADEHDIEVCVYREPGQGECWQAWSGNDCYHGAAADLPAAALMERLEADDA